MPELVELRRDGDICVLTLSREHKLNAVSHQGERELCAELASP
jgi:enoyl-CoA hydratase/carnithine racemase